MKKALAFAITLVMMFSLTSCGIVEGLIENRKNRTYTVHFNAHGGEGEMENCLVEAGDSGYLPKCTFTKEGYECVAWGRDPEGNRFATHLEHMTFWLPSSFKNGDTVEVYAVWTTPGFSFDLVTMGFFGHVVITGYKGEAAHVILPAWYQGDFGDSAIGSCPVAEIDYGVFKEHTELQSVTNICVQDLGDDLFYGCTSLERIEMRRGCNIYDIGDRTFYNCSKLQSVTLTSDLKTIGEEAFYMCTSIEKLVISTTLEELGDRAFFGWTEDQVIEFTRYSENPFGEAAFEGCNATIVWSGV